MQIADLLQIEELLERESLIDVVRERGPMTVAAFMDLALYHPAVGYYAHAPRRSGRAGDLFTSVDVGALFGELLEIQIAEMAEVIGITAEDAQDAEARNSSGSSASSAVRPFDLVEAGAGNGQLSADILRAARTRDPRVYSRIDLHLVEQSREARAAQRFVLGDDVGRLKSAGPEMPASFEGVLIANELLDALPVHQVVMREDGLREVFVEAAADSFSVLRSGRQNAALATREGPLSTPALAEYLERLHVALEPGWRVEINLNAVQWVRETARRLTRGFMILIDYGHEARELYSVTHAAGTLTTFTRHTAAGTESASDNPPWLGRPGEHDITAHVDFTSVRAAAEAEGLVTLGLLDQTYFLLGLLGCSNPENAEHLANPAHLKKRLALKTLLMPGGLGSTMKVLILGKDVGTPALGGCSYKVRVT